MLYTHLKNACNSSIFSSNFCNDCVFKISVLNNHSSFAFITIASTVLNIIFTSSVNSLYFFSVFILIISINVFSPHNKLHLSPTAITISSDSINISVLSNCLFLSGNIFVPLSSSQSLK
ncbi:MAG: hypothetical protein Q8S84_09090 [bacterium]|nr:hypothetical protein [bacterium]MDP3381575.1 hypothetical protein [bacterium]